MKQTDIDHSVQNTGNSEVSVEDKVLQLLNCEKMVNEGIQIAMEAEDPEENLNQMLQYLGEQLMGDRAYIFEKNDHNGEDNTYEWCAEGVEPQIDALQNVPSEVCATWYDAFQRNRVVIIRDLESIRCTDPLVYETLKPQDVNTLVAFPLRDKHNVMGFLGIDNPPVEHIPLTQDILEIASSFIASLLRKRNLVRELQNQGLTDALTGSRNRLAMYNRFAELKVESGIGIVFCDITGLKETNDTKGHSAGDELIRNTYQGLLEAFSRTEVFRIGGDEFVVLIPGITRDELYRRVQKMRIAFSRRRIIVAVGTDWMSEVLGSVETTIRGAETRMYEEKTTWYRVSGRDRRVNESMDEVLRRQQELEAYDKLTGVYTRKGFEKAVECLFTEEGNASDYAIVVTDINDFKSINEIFGINGGDMLLKDLCDCMRWDTIDLNFVGRLESDWFVCLIEKKRMNLDMFGNMTVFEWNYGGKIVQVHLRHGIYMVQDNNLPVAKMIERAVLAKQFVDRKQLRGYAIYDENMRRDYLGQVEVIEKLEKALKNKEFKIFYQPVVELSTNRIHSAEALVRWHKPGLGFVAPDQFVPVLEKNGMITKLDNYVLRAVYRFLGQAKSENLPDFRVSVNLSWQDFYDHHMMDEIISLAYTEGLPVGSVSYEVTETSMAALERSCSYMLEQFRQTGASVLLDDFGSGVSSLGMIGNYPFNVIKIDRSFVVQIETNAKVRTIIKSIVRMCHEMDLQTVAEGVETQEQLDYLKLVECDFIQGYYYAKPMPEEEFLDYLRRYEKKHVEIEKERPVALQQFQILEDSLYQNILDQTKNFVAVISPEDYSLIYLNKVSRSIAKHREEPYRGEKCYYYLNGFQAPCGHCPMKLLESEENREVEVDDGIHVFQVNASVQSLNGKRYWLEIGTDITGAKERPGRYTEQIKSILRSIPDGQGVFHVDITANTWISSEGQAQNARDMQNLGSVDELIRRIASFIPGEEGQEEFFRTFHRGALLRAYDQGQYQIIREVLSYYDDQKIRWSRITAHLIKNPENQHVECLIYGVDISKERESREEQKMQKTLKLYTQADRERRIDYLTRLRNRLDLFEQISTSVAGDALPIRTMYMLDIDNFKQINDHYGHKVGDQCLKELGAALAEFGEQNQLLFFRYGGEEILGLSREKYQDPQKISEVLLGLVRGICVTLADGTEIRFTASLGYTCTNEEFEKMIDYSDRAMFAAKRNGRDQYFCFEDMKKLDLKKEPIGGEYDRSI